MKCKIVFFDWQKFTKEEGFKSVYCSEIGGELACMDFHSGCSYDVDINFDEWQEKKMLRNMENGYIPVFYLAENK